MPKVKKSPTEKKNTITKKKSSSKKDEDDQQNPSQSPKHTEEKKSKSREVVFKDIVVKKFLGDKALTVSQAKKILGWETPPDGVKDKVFTVGGERVWLTNNNHNRPFNLSWAQTLAQEILRGRWQLNGEPLIIGSTGSILSAQHRLIGLVLAAQQREADVERYSSVWKNEPTIEVIMVCGICEEDATVNTLDTGRPRTLWEVICRSDTFADLSATDRKEASRICDYAIRFLWDRTGVSKEAHAPKRTHAESLNFIQRHSRVLECCRHIMIENGGDNSLSPFLSLGYAAGLMYLQGASATEREKDGKGYSEVDEPTETLIDFKQWDQCQNFWVLLGGGDKSLSLVKSAILHSSIEGNGSISEKVAILVKAWNLFSADKPITKKSLDLEYTIEVGEYEDGEKYEIKILVDSSSIGGIDVGEAGSGSEDEIDNEEKSDE